MGLKSKNPQKPLKVDGFIILKIAGLNVNPFAMKYT